MTKRKTIKKSNRLLTYNPNYYNIGGELKNSFKGTNIVSGLINGGIGAIGGAVGNLAGGTIAGGLQSGAGSTISNIGGTIGSAISTVNPVLGGIVSAGSGILGGLTSRAFGAKLNQEKIDSIDKNNAAMSSVLVDNTNNDSVESQWANQNFGSSFTKSDIGKDGWFSNKASDKYKQLVAKQNAARASALTAYSNAANAADSQTDLDALANFSAFGGYIDTSNHFDNGGNLYLNIPNIGQHGGNFSNGITIIGNGGTHESNPMEGVPMGMDENGTPNLVEQGEVKFNDYIFSNRLTAKEKLLNDYGLPTSYANKSFANISKKLSKESDERPNDPISKRGLNDSMAKLQQAQEQLKMKKYKGNKYAEGGGLQFGSPQYQLSVPTIFSQSNIPTFGLSNRQLGESVGKTLSTPLKVPNFETTQKYSRYAPYQIDWNTLSSSQEEGTVDKPKGFNLTKLRYAPVLGAALGLGQTLLNKPDYSSADAILEAANQAGNYTPVDYNPVGNYLQYRPLDRDFYINKLNAQSGATRRAIMNTSNPSRNAALLAADYNAQSKLGDLARQAEEYNSAQRQQVEQFNRGTNQYNSEMGLKVAMANQDALMRAKGSRLSGVAQAMAVRDAVDARRATNINGNLTNFFNSLGDIGREAYSRNTIMSNPALYYSIDSEGKVSYKNGYEDLSEAEKKEVRDAANKADKKKAKGGYLTIKRRN